MAIPRSAGTSGVPHSGRRAETHERTQRQAYERGQPAGGVLGPDGEERDPMNVDLAGREPAQALGRIRCVSFPTSKGVRISGLAGMASDPDRYPSTRGRPPSTMCL